MSKRVFMTGISGMVGSHLVEYLLKKNCIVFALCRWNTKLNNIFHLNKFVKQKKLNLIYGDLLDESSIFKALKISKPKYIFHLAAHSYPTTSFISPKECMETNIIGTLNILEAIKKAHESSTTTMKEKMNDLTGGLNLNLPGLNNND